MDVGLVFGKLAGLFNVDELKALCKAWGIKGFSGLKKADLVSLVCTSRSDEELNAFIFKEGLSKLKAVIDQSVELLNGGSIAGEKLDNVIIGDGDEIIGNFTGLRWTTRFSATTNDLEKGIYSCDCKAFESGGACVHFWVVFLHALHSNKVPVDSGGVMVNLVRDLLPATLTRIKTQATQPAGESRSSEGGSLDEMLAGFTEGARFETARVELGLAKPAPKKVKKTKEASPGQDAGAVQEQRAEVEVSFPVLQTTKPARIEVEFTRIEADGTKRPSSMKILIDEATLVIAHEGCMDYDMRMARQKKLCKHLIQAFLSVDPALARHLLGKVQSFSFLRAIPALEAAQKLSTEMLSAEPVVTVADQDALKGKIMMYLIEHDGDDPTLSAKAIVRAFGADVNDTLAVMVNEGTIEEIKKGFYKVK